MNSVDLMFQSRIEPKRLMFDFKPLSVFQNSAFSKQYYLSAIFKCPTYYTPFLKRCDHSSTQTLNNGLNVLINTNYHWRVFNNISAYLSLTELYNQILKILQIFSLKCQHEILI